MGNAAQESVGRGNRFLVGILSAVKQRVPHHHHLQIGRNADKHTQTKHLYAQLELYFTTLSVGSDTYTPMIL